jgi:hypothetical protein
MAPDFQDFDLLGMRSFLKRGYLKLKRQLVL